ncbi:DNA helicase rad5 [Perkinsus olseni]|uniref:DNA helicase rad5 n=1 Tax=Perkinsus olseni TaxID=32597 RepID=A0A7J6T216_PEROL|nr:DNA helicase rad5 [Perkinsus olseni]KAF4739228.1 DNA helicase rad5 [Perkinsus olseni]
MSFSHHQQQQQYQIHQPSKVGFYARQMGMMFMQGGLIGASAGIAGYAVQTGTLRGCMKYAGPSALFMGTILAITCLEFTASINVFVEALNLREWCAGTLSA